MEGKTGVQDTPKAEASQPDRSPDSAPTQDKTDSGNSNATGDKNQSQGNDAPANSGFDWVVERSACSLPKVFRELMAQTGLDVNTRNKLRPNNAPYQFSIAEKGSDFVVTVQAGEVRKSVTFSLTDHSIVVKNGEGLTMFEVTLSFSEYGDCRLRVNEKDLDYWQVRRMALEDLMFTKL